MLSLFPLSNLFNNFVPKSAQNIFIQVKTVLSSLINPAMEWLVQAYKDLLKRHFDLMRKPRGQRFSQEHAQQSEEQEIKKENSKVNPPTPLPKKETISYLESSLQSGFESSKSPCQKDSKELIAESEQSQSPILEDSLSGEDYHCKQYKEPPKIQPLPDSIRSSAPNREEVEAFYKRWKSLGGHAIPPSILEGFEVDAKLFYDLVEASPIILKSPYWKAIYKQNLCLPSLEQMVFLDELAKKQVERMIVHLLKCPAEKHAYVFRNGMRFVGFKTPSGGMTRLEMNPDEILPWVRTKPFQVKREKSKHQQNLNCA